MAETRRKFDEDFRRGPVQLVVETGKPIAQVARDLGVNKWRALGVREPPSMITHTHVDLLIRPVGMTGFEPATP